LTEDGKLNMDNFEELMDQSPSLVAFTQCSNVLGTINDAEKLTALAKRAGATTLIDAAQSTPHMPVDVAKIGCDFFAFSGHKMLGPTGIGVLYGRKSVLEATEPFEAGGDMIKEVHTTGATWNDLPYKFEAGTQNSAGAVGLGAAVDYLTAIGMQRVREHEEALSAYALEEMGKVPGITVYGPRDAHERGGVVSFNMGDIHPHDMASILDEEGVAIRSGHHCAQPLMELLNVSAMSRASFYIYNSFDDVDALMQALSKARNVFCL
jgi:cysteine desulfurase/selenocysteine lyase